MSDAERLPLRVAAVAFGQVFYEDEHDPRSWADLVKASKHRDPGDKRRRSYPLRDGYGRLTGEWS